MGTLSQAIELLTTPIAFTDEDIADALDVDLAALRDCLFALREIGLLKEVERAESGARRWDAISSDRMSLRRAAADAGIEVDAPLPRSQRRPGLASARARRVVTVRWRGAS